MADEVRKKKLTHKEVAAIAVAATVFVLAAVVVWGVAFGGWLSPGMGGGTVDANASAPGAEQVAVANTGNAGRADAVANANAGSAGLAVQATDAASAKDAENTSATEAESSSSSAAGPGAAGGDKATTAAAGASSTSSSSTAGSSAGGASSGSSGAGSASASQSATITVTLTIDSSRAHAYNAAYAESMGSKTLTLEDGASVYDALCQMGVTISGDSTYVRSINGLAEFACGANSGWIYQVDGVSPNKSCGRYALHGGERIVWIYTCDYVADGL